jgi:hypothetical protein
MSTIASNLSSSDLASRLASLQPVVAGNARATAALNQPDWPRPAARPVVQALPTVRPHPDVTSIAQANQEAALSLITDPAQAATITGQISLQFLAPGSNALASQAPTVSAGLLALLAQT